LPPQAAAKASPAPAGSRQQVETHDRLLAAIGTKGCHRSGERLQRVGVAGGPGQRLDARMGEPQLGSKGDDLPAAIVTFGSR